MTTPESPTSPLTTAGVYRTWWPLASSWLLMGVEMPSIAAFVSRLDDPETHLAAFGGVVFPLALLIEAPIIMMLAASTALSTDLVSFHALRRYMTRMALILTVIQAAIAFTPLLDLIVLRLIGAPESVLEPARLGLQIMSFWTWAIADRRFHQGLLIRFGHQKQVGIGTMVRLVGTATPMIIGFMLELPGIVVATISLASGVFVEALYARRCVRSVIAGPLAEAPAPSEPLTIRRFQRFYLPLALTPLLALASQPIGAAGISRMPEALASLAIWPALNGLSFLTRSAGVAFNEVVVRHAGDQGAPRALGRFAWSTGGMLVVAMTVFAATPLAWWWFSDLTGLEPDLAALATFAVWFSVVLPLLSFLHSYYQGLLVHAHRTRGITEAVGVFLVVTTAVLAVGVFTNLLPGAAMTMVAITAGAAGQAAWLKVRCKQILG